MQTSASARQAMAIANDLAGEMPEAVDATVMLTALSILTISFISEATDDQSAREHMANVFSSILRNGIAAEPLH